LTFRWLVLGAVPALRARFLASFALKVGLLADTARP